MGNVFTQLSKSSLAQLLETAWEGKRISSSFLPLSSPLLSLSVTKQIYLFAPKGEKGARKPRLRCQQAKGQATGLTLHPLRRPQCSPLLCYLCLLSPADGLTQRVGVVPLSQTPITLPLKLGTPRKRRSESMGPTLPIVRMTSLGK